MNELMRTYVWLSQRERERERERERKNGSCENILNVSKVR